MKNLIFRTMVGLALVATTVATGFAVWPPSTSIGNEPNFSTTENVDVGKLSMAERLTLAVSRIERDENRLSLLLLELKQDEEALRKLSSNSKLDGRKSQSSEPVAQESKAAGIER